MRLYRKASNSSRRRAGKLIYEHPLADLKAQGGAVFLRDSSTDRLSLHVFEVQRKKLGLDPGQNPVDLDVTIIGAGARRPSGFEIGRTEEIQRLAEYVPVDVELFSEGVSVVRQELKIKLPTTVFMRQVQPFDPLPDGVPDPQWVVRDVNRYHSLGHIPASGSDGRRMLHIDVARVRIVDVQGKREGLAVIVRVEGTPRMIVLDLDGDGMRDVQFRDQDQDGSFEIGGAVKPPTRMGSWTSEMTECDQICINYL